ncbi:hypothetical protein [Pseudomonas marginalis]|uniref:hypothetical protein n=1 Tax=Pseudomonas marginalis TaxID=298 RepID=UPI002034459B|nr:hypothetical protein [Pseudomonas marginalis]MCM2376852.1 hypothetical protein [Pseudomonas marginalis]
MNYSSDQSAEATELLNSLGVHEVSSGIWAFTDVHTASHCYVHHSQKPVALAAYAAVNPTFAAGRFPGYTLIDLVEKMPCLDGTENAALAMVCCIPAPIFESAAHRGEKFGSVAWDIVRKYQLDACFTKASPYGSEGSHYTMRPCGYDYDRSEPLPEALKAMRSSYRKMTNVQRVMVLTLLHLYSQGTDDFYLKGGCPTKISAAEALRLLRADGDALKLWGYLVTHYTGW